MDPCLVCRVEWNCFHSTLHTRQSSVQNNKYQVSHKDSCFSWWWAHIRPKNLEKRNKYTTKNYAPSWLYLQDYTGMFGQQNIKLLTYSMEQSPWEANRFPASQEIPAFYGTRMFITAVTTTRHLSLSRASSIQSIPHVLKIHLNIILPSTPRSTKWSSSFKFPHQNPVHAYPLHHTCYIPYPSLLDFHSFSILSNDRSKASSKTIPPHSAI